MNKIKQLIAISLLIFLLILSACGTKNETEGETSSNPDATESNTSAQIQLPEEYTIYYDDSLGETQLISETKNNITVARWSTVPHIGLGNPIEDASAAQKRSISLDGKNYEMIYDETRANALSESGNLTLSKCGIWDVYKSDNFNETGTIMEFDKEGKLVFFFTSAGSRNNNGLFSEEEAKTRAEVIVKDLYGNDILEKYSVIETDTIETNKQTRVFYYKKVADRVADEFIMVVFNNSGEVVGLNAKRMGYFDPFAERITEEHITSAESKLLEAFPTYSIVDDEAKMIVIDAKGQYYLCQNIRSEAEKKSHFLLINLE